MAQKGCFIVVPVERDDHHLRRPGRCKLVGQSAVKFEGWDSARFTEAGFRAVPNCVVRRSAYIAPGVVLMPSFVNLGAYVDSGTMVDTWATVGSCAQIGKNVIYRAVRALAACWSLCRQSGYCGRWLFHWRALRGCRRRDCARRRSFVDGVFILLRQKLSTGLRAKSIVAKCRPIRLWCPVHCRADPISLRCLVLLSSKPSTRKHAQKPPSTIFCGTDMTLDPSNLPPTSSGVRPLPRKMPVR